MCPRGPKRDLCLILKGEARAEVNGEVVRTMSAGDFSGELAALDWGAGYGYTRLATGVATSPARLVVVPPDVFNRLIREVPWTSNGGSARRSGSVCRAPERTRPRP